jgi:uncharacterized protein YhaN
LSNALVDDINNPSSLPSGSKSEFHHLNQGLHADRQNFPEQLKKIKPTEQSIDGRLNEMLSLVQDLRDRLEKEKQDRRAEMESEKQDRRVEMEKERQDREMDVKSLSAQLDKERADRKEDVEALRRVSPHVCVRLLRS